MTSKSCAARWAFLKTCLTGDPHSCCDFHVTVISNVVSQLAINVLMSPKGKELVKREPCVLHETDHWLCQATSACSLSTQQIQWPWGPCKCHCLAQHGTCPRSEYFACLSCKLLTAEANAASSEYCGWVQVPQAGCCA